MRPGVIGSTETKKEEAKRLAVDTKRMIDPQVAVQINQPCAT